MHNIYTVAYALPADTITAGDMLAFTYRALLDTDEDCRVLGAYEDRTGPGHTRRGSLRVRVETTLDAATLQQVLVAAAEGSLNRNIETCGARRTGITVL